MARNAAAVWLGSAIWGGYDGGVGSSEDRVVLDYAMPRGRARETVYLGIASWVCAFIAVLANGCWLADTSFESYIRLMHYAGQRGYWIPPAHEVLGWRIPFGAMSYCMGMVDVQVHIALAGVLAVAGFMAVSRSPHTEAVYWLYIRWKLVFACVSVYVWLQLESTSFTFVKNTPLGYSEFFMLTLLVFACAFAVPLVLLWYLQRANIQAD